MSNHTPGPWKAEPPTPDPEYGESPKYHWTIRAPGTSFGCISFQLAELSSMNRPEDEADARLIAAAPDLLEALVTAERFMSGFEGDSMQVGIEGYLRQIRAAIAKASGSQS